MPQFKTAFVTAAISSAFFAAAEAASRSSVTTASVMDAVSGFVVTIPVPVTVMPVCSGFEDAYSAAPKRKAAETKTA